MAFPQTPLDVRIDLQINGIWTDVTSDVYTAEKITISRGRADEGVRSDPGKCSLTFNNRLGKYSPRNPLSPYYRLIGRNTPLRVSVRAGSPFLALTGDVADFASTPDTAVLDITGDLDLRWEGEADWYADGAQTLIGKWEATGNQKAYLLRLENRNLIIHQSLDGLNGASFGRLLPALPRRAALRATLDVDNGAGGKTARFYWAHSIAGPWTEFAEPSVLGGTTAPVFSSTAPLRVAPADLTATVPRYPVGGRVYKAEVRNGIGGSVVANPDFAAQAVGAASFVDSAGLTWTLNGAAAITNRRVRFIGEVSSWPSRWDVSGKDIRVPVEAQGILRRLGQGQQALQSTLRRRIPSAIPRAFWPLEDGRTATQFYSPIAGVQPMRTAGFDLASDDSLAGSSALPVVQEGAVLFGTVPTLPGASTQWHTEFVFNLPNAGPATARTVLQWTSTGTVKRWRLMLRTGVSEIYGYDSDDNVVTSSIVNLANLGVFNTWSRWQLYAVQNGGNVDWTVRWIPIGGQGGQVGVSYAGVTGRINGVSGPTGGYHSDLNGLRLGHIAALPTANTTIYNSADLGFAGETAGVRMMRLREEENVPLVINGVVANMEQVGAQRPDTILGLLEEAAGVDGGILGERREDIALAYRDRISLYNQRVTLALDYLTAGHIAPPLEPIDDDQKVRNDVTREREGGASARAVLEEGPLSIQAPPNGVGVYDEALTLNLYRDEQAERHAWWGLHLGTVDEARYPVLNVDLAAAPSLIDAVTDVDSGDRITIAHPPPHLPPDMIDLLAQGYQEVIGHPIDWDLSFNCTPASPWTIGVVGDTTLGKANASPGATLLAVAAAAADTQLTVHTPASGAYPPVPWITSSGPGPNYPAEFPYDVRFGGETARVTANSPAIWDQFGRTVASGWGTADSGQTWTVTGTAADYAVGSGYGSATQPTVGIAHLTLTPAPSADLDLYVDIATSALATGASLFAGPLLRAADNNNHYAARVDFNTSAGIVLTLRKRVAGVETQLATYTSPLTHVAGTFYRVRLQAAGTSLKAKIWATTAFEPIQWHAQATDAALTAAANVGTRSFSNTGNTNTNPQMRFDNFQLPTLQRMTVQRSLNGVTKSHAVGAELLLVQPAVVAL